jgi:glucose/mannose transport system substrate-binding protein
MSRFEGKYYSVPLSVHRVNVVWYNKSILDRKGIDPEKLGSWPAFFEAAESLRADGLASPIQMGEAWTASMVFQGIVASLGMETYEDWVNGKITNPADPRMLEALAIFRTYLSYVNPDHPRVGWDVAIKKLIAGESAFCVMGDWANGEFRLAGKKYGKQYGTIAIPGTGGMYALTIDTFLRPRSAAHPTSSERWLKLAASREGQDAFNSLKGSVSARSDADMSLYDLYQKAAAADLKAARHLYPSLDSAAPDAFRVRQNDVIAAFSLDKDVKKAAAALAEATIKASGKFSRTWKLK